VLLWEDCEAFGTRLRKSMEGWCVSLGVCWGMGAWAPVCFWIRNLVGIVLDSILDGGLSIGSLCGCSRLYLPAV